ncbi:hypothetical protein L228DRAFT_282588 [Xylona heveae TC161]|uniref:WD40 repeat-like protein n=1 Tax=Xylona heveae (strain CBS 132557 / TC161) TaxID=1328760 RepID=A0A165GQK2_XYLHT|nr:hypothetical protein L228DRAFT_282588 [Xylona heveae TC161]KZF22472.1 hypothetical protein L228DRAFT_282588 [Xylona heveae TC161]
MSSRRQSGRKRQRTSYNLDPLAGLDILSEDSQLEDTEDRYDDSGEDDEFHVRTKGQGNEVQDDEDEVEEEESEDEEEEDATSMIISDEEANENESRTPRKKRKSSEFAIVRRDKIKRRDADSKNESKTHRPRDVQSSAQPSKGIIRGVPEMHKSGTKREMLTNLAGDEDAGIIALLRSRSKWCNDPTLPRRHAKDNGTGGLDYSFFLPEEVREKEATLSWRWYDNGGGKKSFRMTQQTQALSPDSAIEFLPRTGEGDCKVFMGLWKDQKLVTIPNGESISIEECWKPDDPIDGQSQQSSKKNPRLGWMLNAGDKVQCIDWAPNNKSGVQYLALCTNSLDNKTDRLNPPAGHPSRNVAPAYSPSPATPSCIQIWGFPAAAADQHGQCQPDLTKSPSLRLVICTEWGPVKQLKWCRALRNQDETDSIGLLGAVFGDGKLRVFDVFRPGVSNQETPTQYLHITKPAFESGPPESICTSLDWLSSHDIVVGCANGFVAVFDIRPRPSDELPRPWSPTPWFYQHIHGTYVLSVTSGYPSRPHILLTASMDGYLRATDLRSPKADSVLSQRSRIGNSVLAWSDHMQAAMSADEQGHVRLSPLRRFYSTIAVARPQNHGKALLMSLAAGVVHPMILAGTIDGAAVATNPLRRLLNSKSVPQQQTWFFHEWSRQDGGISRIVEGFKVESVVLQPSKDEHGSSNRISNAIFEERSSITDVSWNPNLSCGGWAAAGMGSGLVRVEDLAL